LVANQWQQSGLLTGKYNDSIPDDSRFGTSKDAYAVAMKEEFGSEEWVKEITLVKKLKASLVQ